MNSDTLTPSLASSSSSSTTTTPATSNGTSLQHKEESNTTASGVESEDNRSTVKVKTSECDYQSENCSAAKKSRPNEEDTEKKNEGEENEQHQNNHENHHEHHHNHNHHHHNENHQGQSHHSHTSRMPPLSSGHIYITNDIQNPRQLLAHLLPSFDMSKLPASFDDFDICRLVYQVMAGGSSGEASGGELPPLPPIDFDNLASLELDSSLSALNYASAISSIFLTPREKLNEYNTIDDCLDLIESSRNIIVLTGAGCSVSCGIPDFRSRDGIYARLHVEYPDLPDPQSMFDILYFEHDPRPFFKFAKEIYPGQYQPSLSHRFIRKLELKDKLLRNYTQNIDTLELAAQINNVIQCHGSFATATCTNCKFKVSSTTSEKGEKQSENDEEDHRPGILKPDIVFFGEGLPEVYHKSINDDKNKCDLLIVIGSSLKVKPVANIPLLLPKNIPQVLINRESLKHMNFDIELLGDCDGIVNEILMRLEQRRLARLSNKDSTTENNSHASKLDQVDEVEWADICREKTLLQKYEGKEAEDLVFAGENRSTDENSEEASLDENNALGIHEDDKKKPNENEEEEENGDKPKEAEEEKQTETKKQEGEQNDEEEAKIKSNNNEAADESNRVVYTKDYLKESSYLYLKPNIHIFHGAEVSLRFMHKKLRRLRKSYDRFVNGGSSSKEQPVGGDKKEILEEDQELDDYDSDDDEFSDDYDDEEETEEEEEEEDTDDDDDDDGEENDCSLKKLMEMHNESGEQEEESDEEFSLGRKAKAKEAINKPATTPTKLNGNHREQTENAEKS